VLIFQNFFRVTVLEAAAARGAEVLAQVIVSLPEDVLPPDLEEQAR
jgi:hypothetical protein